MPIRRAGRARCSARPTQSRWHSGTIDGMTDTHPTVRELINAGRDREAAARGANPLPPTERPITEGDAMDAIAQITDLGPVLDQVVAGIDPTDLDLPTPCAEYTVRDLLEHMRTGALAFAAAFRGEQPPAPDNADPLTGVMPALAGLVDAMTAPGALDGTVTVAFGALPAEHAARFVALDGLVHGWDLAQATGQPYAPPDELITEVTTFAHQAIDAMRETERFGPAQPAPADASPIDALAAFTGRAVHRPGATTPNRALWEKGDFTRIADTMRRSGDELVDRIGIRAGMRVLDVGCGDGTTAIPAAQRGADVLGVDISTNLLAAARRRARSLGVDTIRFEPGDVRDLSWLPADSFDAVVSIFGAMFAPEPERVARELVRVARPGGRVVMGNWIPGDPTLVAQILRICSAYAPPPPNAVSPMLWGVDDEVKARFAAAGVATDAVTCERDWFTFYSDGTPAGFVDDFLRYYGPTMNAYATAQADGKGDQLRHELEELFASCNTAGDGGTEISAAYLRVTVAC
jgi:uncharacterized protein (TIGR03086 family)